MASREIMQRADHVRERAVRITTWHQLSLLVARLVLLVFGSLWLRSYWFKIGPQFYYVQDGHYLTNPGMLLTGALDAFLAIGLAVACSTVPSIFAAGLIPNSPASALLSGFEQKYGRAGYYFALIGALVFTTLGGFTLYGYWLSRPAVSGIDLTVAIPQPTAYGFREVILQTVASLFLMIGFPAWALNRMTPEQWVDAILQAREVARIKRIIDLEDMAEKAIIARARTLLYADLTRLTLEQRRENAREVAAILSAAHRGFYVSLRQIGETFKSLHGMELTTQVDPDDAVIRRYAYLADTLSHAAEEAAGYVEKTEQTSIILSRATANETANDEEEQRTTSATVRLQDAEMVDRTNEGANEGDRDRGPQRTTTDHRATANDRTTTDAFNKSRQSLHFVHTHLGAEVWRRAQIEKLLNIEKTKAVNIIKEWQAAGLVEEVADPRYHYQFAPITSWPVEWREEAN